MDSGLTGFPVRNRRSDDPELVQAFPGWRSSGSRQPCGVACQPRSNSGHPACGFVLQMHCAGLGRCDADHATSGTWRLRGGIDRVPGQAAQHTSVTGHCLAKAAQLSRIPTRIRCIADRHSIDSIRNASVATLLSTIASLFRSATVSSSRNHDRYAA